MKRLRSEHQLRFRVLWDRQWRLYGALLAPIQNRRAWLCHNYMVPAGVVPQRQRAGQGIYILAVLPRLRCTSWRVWLVTNAPRGAGKVNLFNQRNLRAARQQDPDLY